MITLYTTFRSFKHPKYAKIQHDAIASWLRLKPVPQIVALGDDGGTAEVCKRYGFKHIPVIPVSKAGTPYMDTLIQRAEDVAKHDIMLLCCSDIIITQDTIPAARAIKKLKDQFCVCARKKHVQCHKGKVTEVRWATWQAGDYWLHSKGIFKGMPRFLIGRHLLERWMYRFLCNKDALIDGTPAITVKHQLHPHDFKPEHGELRYNRKLYDQNFFDVEKWKDTDWYPAHKLFNIGINFANYILTKDYQLMENNDPTRHDWHV